MEKIIRITLRWENNKFFEMKQKEENNPDNVVIHVDEDGHITDDWGSISRICSDALTRHLKQVGDEMAS